MSEPWVYREPPGRTPHLPTTAVSLRTAAIAPWTLHPYDPAAHLARLALLLPDSPQPPSPVTGPGFTPWPSFGYAQTQAHRAVTSPRPPAVPPRVGAAPGGNAVLGWCAGAAVLLGAVALLAWFLSVFAAGLPG